MSDSPLIVTRTDLLHRIRAEYLEMPGLRLTAAQAGRLWGLEPPTCNELLERLLRERFLQRRPDGTYARLTDGVPPRTPLRVMLPRPVDPADARVAAGRRSRD
jgi:hypothetical protein